MFFKSEVHTIIESSEEGRTSDCRSFYSFFLKKRKGQALGLDSQTVFLGEIAGRFAVGSAAPWGAPEESLDKDESDRAGRGCTEGVVRHEGLL